MSRNGGHVETIDNNASAHGCAGNEKRSNEGFEMIGQTEIRATLLERASSLMQGFEGGLLVLQVCCTSPMYSAVLSGAWLGCSSSTYRKHFSWQCLQP